MRLRNVTGYYIIISTELKIDKLCNFLRKNDTCNKATRG